MTKPVGLEQWELALIIPVFQKHRLEEVILYGSRAMGTNRPGSDVDLAIVAGRGTPDEEAKNFRLAAAVSSDLDQLPLPYIFDVSVLELIKHEALLDHIRRVGVAIFSTHEDNQKLVPGPGIEPGQP